MDDKKVSSIRKFGDLGWGNRPFQVTGGPSREALFDALRIGLEGGKVHFVITFPQMPREKVSTSAMIYCLIKGVENINDSRYPLYFRGETRWLWRVKVYDPDVALGHDWLSIEYNTVTRKGDVKVL